MQTDKYHWPTSRWSLFDMGVFAVVAALLISVMLPAVNASRDDAHRLACAENMRSMSQAFHQFADARQAFPPRRTGFGGAKAYGGWGAEILPFLKPDLADRFQGDYDYYDPVNKDVVETKVAVFLCPAAPSDRVTTVNASASAGSRNPDRTTLFTVNAGANDYISSNGMFVPSSGYGVNWPRELRGNDHQPMTDNDALPFRRITDGLANTFLIVEKAGLPDVWRNGEKTSNAQPIGGENSRGAWAGFGSIAFRAFDRADGTSSAKGDSSDCAVNCNNFQGIYSFHAEGANVLFCDGSVRFVTPELDGLTFARLTTRDDGQTIDPAAF